MATQLPENARRKDIGPIANMLAAAFMDEPGLSWMVADREARKRTLPGFFRAIVSGTLRNGLVLHAPDNSAATLWRLPDKTNPGILETFLGLPAMAGFLKQSGSRARIIGNAVKTHAPRHPFRYLQFAGVHPDFQGTGRGGAVIRTGLEAATAAGEPVYLETPKTENVAIYSRMGFEVIDQWPVEGTGLTFTSMLKKP